MYATYNPKVPINSSKWSYVQEQSDFVLPNYSSLDVKCNNLGFVDPKWMIPIGEETLEPYRQRSIRNSYQFMDLKPLKSRIIVGNRVS